MKFVDDYGPGAPLLDGHGERHEPHFPVQSLTIYLRVVRNCGGDSWVLLWVSPCLVAAHCGIFLSHVGYRPIIYARFSYSATLEGGCYVTYRYLPTIYELGCGVTSVGLSYLVPYSGANCGQQTNNPWE